MQTFNAFIGGKMMLTFSPQVNAAGLAEILYQGRRHEEFLALDQWRQFSTQCQSLFPCAFCSENVVQFRVSDPNPDRPKSVILSCRCTTLRFIAASPFRTQDQWSQWQTDYAREILDPAPIEALRAGLLTGTVESAGSDWLSRRFGLPEGLQFDLGGTIRAGDASLLLDEHSIMTMLSRRGNRSFRASSSAGCTQYLDYRRPAKATIWGDRGRSLARLSC
jgi:hypothetical protein